MSTSDQPAPPAAEGFDCEFDLSRLDPRFSTYWAEAQKLTLTPRIRIDVRPITSDFRRLP